MTVKFLLFQGNWEHEGNFCALETEQSILLLSVGENAPFLNHQEIINYDYLIKNKSKIKAIFLNNTLPKNCAFLPFFYQKLALQVPIYGSKHTSLILDYLWPSQIKIKDAFRTVETNKVLKVGDFYCRFLPLNSHVLGNLAIMINHQDYTFYCLEDFALNNLLNNSYLSDAAFFAHLKDLLVHQKPHTYLITSTPNLNWNRQNSLLLAARSWEKDKNYFFLLYDYDWLHILELCELAHQWQKKIQVLNPSFLILLKKVLKNDKLKEVLVEDVLSVKGSIIYLLIGSPSSIEGRLKDALEGKHFAKKDTFSFMVGISSNQGGIGKIASILDYLYQKKGEVGNFSRHEAFSLGASLADLKLLLDVIQPHSIITLQNSYKQKNFLAYLRKDLLTCPNQSYLVLSNKKIYPFPAKEKWTTEKILLAQRESLLQEGFLIILIIASWEKKLLKIKSLQLETVAVSLAVNLKKVEEKIKQWWEKKVNSDLANREWTTNDFDKKNLSEISKKWRKAIEGYLKVCLKRYLNFEYNIELKEPFILLFLKDQKQRKAKETYNFSKNLATE